MSSMQLQISQPDDLKLFRQVIADYCKTWTTLPNQDRPDWSKVYKLYADVDGLMFYDAVTPHSFRHPDEMKAVFPPVENLKLIPHDDLQVYRYGDLIWTTITQSVEALGKDGSQLSMIQRQTAIWQYQDESWVMLHEHLSLPSSLT
jgi:ketosteroid isomerase-like protein